MSVLRTCSHVYRWSFLFICFCLHSTLYLWKNSGYVHLDGYPAADIRIVSNTPQALNCWTARFGSNLTLQNIKSVSTRICLTFTANFVQEYAHKEIAPKYHYFDRWAIFWLFSSNAISSGYRLVHNCWPTWFTIDAKSKRQASGRYLWHHKLEFCFYFQLAPN